MTVYNRKMFRKKAGGATGIMASGPELMKRFRVGGVNRFGILFLLETLVLELQY